jgi:hypothetical protein
LDEIKMLEMPRSIKMQGGLYMLFMGTVVAVTLYFGLIPSAQMGLRLDTLPIGIVAGLLCQLPLLILSFLPTSSLPSFLRLLAKPPSMETVKRARMHFYAAPLDAPIAELFWSGVVVSSIVALLASLGLTSLFAGILGVLLGVGIHLTSHVGPMKFLVPEEGGWVGFFLTMALSRAAFVISANIVAPILGHALGSLLGLVIWRMKGQTESIL